MAAHHRLFIYLELHASLKLVEPMGVEPTICLLAKQMPLPHSSHGPMKNFVSFEIGGRMVGSNHHGHDL